MAQTTGVMNSTLMAVWIESAIPDAYVKVGTIKGASLSISHSPREISSKDSAGWQEFLEGMRGATVEVSFLYAENAAQGYAEFLSELYTLGDATKRGLVSVRYSTGEVGDVAIDFNAYITGLENNSPEQEDNVTASCSLQITGLPVITTLA